MPKRLATSKRKKRVTIPSVIRASGVSFPKEFATGAACDSSVDVIEAGEGDDKKPATFTLMANTGKPMNLDGFPYPVVIDMQGAKFDKKRTPVIADHDTSKRIGHTTEGVIIPAGGVATLGGKDVKGPLIGAVGVPSSSMGIAQGIVADAKNGFPFQVSVGAGIQPDGAEFVAEGETVEVNNRKIKGPVIVARKTNIRELTITVLGADNNTSATVAATIKKEIGIMPKELKAFIEAMGLVAEDLSKEQVAKIEAQWKKTQTAEGGDTDPTPVIDLTAQRAAQAEEQDRIDTINAHFTKYTVTTVSVDGKDIKASTFKKNAIRDGLAADKVELALMRASMATGGASGPAVHMAQSVKEFDNKTLACAVVKASGMVPANKTHEWSGEKYGYEHAYDEQTLEASDHKDLRNVSLHQLMDLQIIAATGLPFSGNRRSDDFIQACRAAQLKIRAASGFTTLEVTNVFDDAAHKLLWAGYQSVNTTWQEWAKVVSVNDFKTNNFYRMTSKGGYQQVGADGELKHGGFTDDKYTVAADTYGKIVGMTRKHLINDDMDAFNNMMSWLGIEGAKTVEELAYVYLLNQVGTMWTAGNNNLGTGAGSDLTIAGISASNKLYEDQVDADNSPIMIEPDRILVGTQDRVYAGQLYNDTEIREGRGSTSSKEEFTKNPHTSAYRPIVSGYLNNTNIKQRVANIGDAIPNQDTDQWFHFGNPNNPQGASIMVAFLNGRREPILEQADANFNVLGLQWRGYHDVGTGSGDPKLSVRNAGA